MCANPATNTGSEENNLLAGNTISKGYLPPVNKQGIYDQRFYDAVSILCPTTISSSSSSTQH